jgi:hypothetical protein
MSEAVLFEDLDGLRQPLNALKPHPDNYNQGDINTIAESLRVNGMYKPVIYDRATGHILAGNHTWQAARALGWTDIAAIGINVTPEEAKRILAVDNQSARKSVFDDDLLADLLSSLPVLEGTGFTDADLDDLLASIEEPTELPQADTDAAFAALPPQQAPVPEAATPSPAASPAAVPDPDRPEAKPLAEVVLVMETEVREGLLRDLDAIASLLGGLARGPACARALRIALAVVDAAEVNPELKRLMALADPAGDA